MTDDDVVPTERTSDITFSEGDNKTRRVNESETQPRSRQASAAWVERMGYLRDTDPDGCWVAANGHDVIGFAVSQNRADLWFLATYGVLPDHQGLGIGKALMDRVLAHADGRPGLLCSTVHAGATRRYRRAGFHLHPQLRMVGAVDRSKLRVPNGVVDGTSEDLDWMDELDRAVRGAGHGPDHRFMIDRLRLRVVDSLGHRGYVYIDADRGRPMLLAASDVPTAQNLLWDALAASDGPTLVNCITVENEWAVDVGLAAGLDIGQEGYLAVRGIAPPAPYLASGHFL